RKSSSILVDTSDPWHIKTIFGNMLSLLSGHSATRFFALNFAATDNLRPTKLFQNPNVVKVFNEICVESNMILLFSRHEEHIHIMFDAISVINETSFVLWMATMSHVLLQMGR
ncbi:hypothetical protein ACJX0J_037228, partial [Zea mays]